MARNPGVGGTPLTEAMSCLLSSEKTIWLTDPAGPVAGVVWLRLSGRLVPATGTKPFFLTEKQLGVGVSTPESRNKAMFIT